MALVRVLQESDFGVVPPWETAPYGVVSLLAMLQFDAGFFVKAAFKLTMWEARYSMPSSANLPIHRPRSGVNRFQNSIKQLAISKKPRSVWRSGVTRALSSICKESWSLA